MRALRCFYLWAYEFIKGHYPIGALVKFKPHIGFDGIYWKSPGDPRINSIGMVIGGWRKYKHPYPPNMLIKGSIVLFDNERYDMEDFELEVIDEGW